jgi:hypothetical protein
MVFVIVFLFSLLISYRWVKGVDYMMENHPDYKGEDLI